MPGRFIASAALICAVILAGAPLSASDAPNGRLTIDALVDFAQQQVQPKYPDFVWDPSREELLFSADSGAESWIFRYAPASGTRTRVIQGSDPAISPDGAHLAFLRQTVAPDTGDRETQVWTSNADGSNPTQGSHIKGGLAMTGTSSNELVWAPDSKRVLFQDIVVGSALGPGSAIGGPKTTPSPPPSVRVFPLPTADLNRSNVFHVLDVTTGEDRVVGRGVEAGQYTWIDDDDILIERNDRKIPGHWDCEVVSERLSLHRVTRLLAGYNQQCVNHPIINRQRTEMAFQADPGEESIVPSRRELSLKDLRSGKIRILTHLEASLGKSKAWTPDGHWLIYSSGRSLHQSLYMTDGRQPIRLLSTVTRILRVDVSSDGKLIAWSSFDARDVTRMYVGTLSLGRIVNIRQALITNDPTKGLRIGRSTAIEWHSVDGLTIDGALTLPVGYQAGKHYPVVVMVHGGPWSGVLPNGEWPGGIKFVEYLAQQGYVVFQPDYRSSGYEGYDQILMLRQRREEFQPDQDDILSGVRYLEREGIADPRHLFVLGHSNGGAEVNWLITHTSTFAAAISYEGWDVLWDYAVAYGADTMEEWRLRGTPMNEWQTYVDNSAVAHAGNITTPTLFINSHHDDIFSDSPFLFAVSRRLGIDSSYVVYPGDGHMIGKAENQRDLLVRTMAWLKRHNERRAHQ